MAVSLHRANLIEICDQQELRIDEQLCSKPHANKYQVRIPTDLPDAVVDCLHRRYRLAGWSRVEIVRMHGDVLMILEE